MKCLDLKAGCKAWEPDNADETASTILFKTITMCRLVSLINDYES